MIALNGVTKTYANNPQAVLENVHLKIGKGEFVYLVGDSGAGKTTLLKLLFGEEFPNRGDVEMFGEILPKQASSRLQTIRRRMGVIFQDLRLIDELSVIDNIILSLEISRIKGSLVRAAQEALSIVGFLHFKRKVKYLSGGERSRVAVARAIATHPDILVADEPTGSLDWHQTWNLMDLFQKLHLQGTTILIATHDREIVRRIRRRSCVLKNGKLTLEDGLCFF